MRLWLVRHAPVDAPPGLCYGRSDLTAQAAATADAARHLHATIGSGVRIRCSPARRCLQLADALLALRSGLRVHVDADLQEMDFGRWEGRPWNDIDTAEFDAWMADFSRHRPGGGESVQALLERTRRALQNERAQSGESLWITHAGVIRAARLLLAGVESVSAAADRPREPVPFGTPELHLLGN